MRLFTDYPPDSNTHDKRGFPNFILIQQKPPAMSWTPPKQSHFNHHDEAVTEAPSHLERLAFLAVSLSSLTSAWF